MLKIQNEEFIAEEVGFKGAGMNFNNSFLSEHNKHYEYLKRDELIFKEACLGMKAQNREFLGSIPKSAFKTLFNLSQII